MPTVNITGSRRFALSICKIEQQFFSENSQLHSEPRSPILVTDSSIFNVAISKIIEHIIRHFCAMEYPVRRLGDLG
jgi:hypothetical protein